MVISIFAYDCTAQTIVIMSFSDNDIDHILAGADYTKMDEASLQSKVN